MRNSNVQAKTHFSRFGPETLWAWKPLTYSFAAISPVPEEQGVIEAMASTDHKPATAIGKVQAEKAGARVIARSTYTSQAVPMLCTACTRIGRIWFQSFGQTKTQLPARPDLSDDYKLFCREVKRQLAEGE